MKESLPIERLPSGGSTSVLTPDTRNLNTAGKGNYPYHPSGVDRCRARWTRIFTLGQEICELFWVAGADRRFARVKNLHPK